MLLREIRNIYQEELEGIYPKTEIDSFLDILLEHYLGFGRFVMALQPEYTLTKEEEQPLFEALARLRQEEPIQYITGSVHFYGRDFTVNPHVLIPRPETEDLIRWILECQGGHEAPLKILDVGTGSGNIAITLARELPQAEVHALDISSEALAVARQNAAENKATVQFVQADFRTLKHLEHQWDLLVSNPPYVRLSESREMSNNVKRYEPAQALFVPDEAPLLFYELLARFGKANLKTGGMLFLEINEALGTEVQQLLSSEGYTEIEVRRDLFGKERMISAVFKKEIL